MPDEQNPPAGTYNITAEDTPVIWRRSDILTADPTHRFSDVWGIHCTATILDNGDLLITPDPEFSGYAEVHYTILDDQGGYVGGASAGIEVTPVNDAPEIAPFTTSTHEDTPLVLSPADFAYTITDAEGDAVSFAGVGNPVGGTVALVDGNIVFVPAPDYSGPASFELTVSDGNGGVTTSTVAVDVMPVYDAPVAGDDALDVRVKDGKITIDAATLLANDSTVEGGPLTILMAIDTVGGWATVTADGIEFVPDYGGYTGPASFRYLVQDAQGVLSVASVSLNVLPNNGPVLGEDVLTTAEDTALVIDPATLLANDTDADGDALTVTNVSNAVGGTVALVDGAIVFTPDPEFSGAAQFDYEVTDGQGGYASRTVAVDVAVVNDAPQGSAQSSAIFEGESLVVSAGDLAAMAYDLDGDAVSVTAVGDAVGGAVALVDGSIVFTPAPEFSGQASFTYTLTDANGACTVVPYAVQVHSVQDAPVAADDFLSTAEDTPLVIDPAQLLANDSDADGEPLSVTEVFDGYGGTVALVDGQVVFTPEPNSNNEAFFYYAVTDGAGNTAMARAMVAVTPVNDAPSVVPVATMCMEDGVALIGTDILLANAWDPDNDTFSLTAVGDAVGGTVELVDGNVVFTAQPDFFGMGSFSYTLTDQHGAATVTTASVLVEGWPDEPVAADDSFGTAENTPLVLDQAQLLANDSDVDGDVLSVSEVGNAVGGSVELVDGAVVFTPDAGFTGEASFTYGAFDGYSADYATVHVTVTQAETLVQAMASFDPPALGEADAPANQTPSQDVVYAADWQNH